MMIRTCLIIGLLGVLPFTVLFAGPKIDVSAPIPADACTENYIGKLRGKKIGIVMNLASVYRDSLILDRLLVRGVKVAKIFVPEHGFRGQMDAGEHVNDTIDAATGIPVVSLYGGHNKPDAEDLVGLDWLVYDLQDVGVRFYTYISTLQYCMEACATNNVGLMVLDRPNPNGFYVDGPVLDTSLRSFVGMQPIPIVYGMTCGEYARMLKGEHWFAGADLLKLEVILCKAYSHASKYILPVPPSPNLRDMCAVYAYPSLCLFEGTVISVGRGTDRPFRQYGHPELKNSYTYNFLPTPGVGSKHPLLERQYCYGEEVAATDSQILHRLDGKFYLGWLLKAYRAYPYPEQFFNNFFNRLAGNTALQQAVKDGKTEAQIRRSWEPDLITFRKVRKKYLLYEDFDAGNQRHDNN